MHSILLTIAKLSASRVVLTKSSSRLFCTARKAEVTAGCVNRIGSASNFDGTSGMQVEVTMEVKRATKMIHMLAVHIVIESISLTTA